MKFNEQRVLLLFHLGQCFALHWPWLKRPMLGPLAARTATTCYFAFDCFKSMAWGVLQIEHNITSQATLPIDIYHFLMFHVYFGVCCSFATVHHDGWMILFAMHGAPHANFSSLLASPHSWLGPWPWTHLCHTCACGRSTNQ